MAAASLSTIVGNSIAATTGEKNKDKHGVAKIDFDGVAYHKDGKPVLSSGKYEIELKNAKWRFFCAEHRDLFKVDSKSHA